MLDEKPGSDERTAHSSARLRRIGCIQAGASFRSLTGARRLSAGVQSTAGPGSSRIRTGAIIARLMHLFATMKPEAFLQGSKKTYFETAAKPAPAVLVGTR